MVLFSEPFICIFLLNKSEVSSCSEQTSMWAASTAHRMTWREEQSTVCVRVVWLRSKLLFSCTHTCPGVISIYALWIKEPFIVHASSSQFTISVSLLCDRAGNHCRKNVKLFLKQLSFACPLISEPSQIILNVPITQNCFFNWSCEIFISLLS